MCVSISICSCVWKELIKEVVFKPNVDLFYKLQFLLSYQNEPEPLLYYKLLENRIRNVLDMELFLSPSTITK